jgi:hypothetical protein
VVEIRSLLRLVPNNRPITRPERPTIGSVISAASPVPVETHVAPGRAVDASAYDRWIGRWSRLFVPSVPCRGQYDEHKFRQGLRLPLLRSRRGTGCSMERISRPQCSKDRRIASLNLAEPRLLRDPDRLGQYGGQAKEILAALI